MYVETEFKWKRVVEDVCLRFYVIMKITKMITLESNNKKKVRDEIEELTKQKDKLEGEYETICKKIEKLPTSRLKDLRGLCDEKAKLFSQIKFLEEEKLKKTNLFNTIE